MTSIPKFLAEAPKSLSEGAEQLGLRVSWIKTEVQAFGDILDATIESIPVSCVNVEVTPTFTYLGSVIHLSTSCKLEVNRRLGRAWSAMNSMKEGVALPSAIQRRSEFFIPWSWRSYGIRDRTTAQRDRAVASHLHSLGAPTTPL